MSGMIEAWGRGFDKIKAGYIMQQKLCRMESVLDERYKSRTVRFE